MEPVPAPDLAAAFDPRSLSLSRLHWTSLFFDTFSHLREYVVPAAFAFLGAARGDWFWGVLAIVAFGASFLATLFRFFTLRYGVQNGELLVNQGLIFHNRRVVPCRRIQNMDLKQNLLHRMFGVAEVRIETASGNEAEAVLRVLHRSQIEVLRQQIFEPLALPAGTLAGLQGSDPAGTASGVGQELPADPVAGLAAQTPAARGAVPQVAVPVLKVPLRWLLAAGLASNRGWLLVGIVIGLVFQFQNWEQFDGRSFGRLLRKWLPLLFDAVPGPWQIALALLAGLVALKLLGMAWFVLRFHGYQLVRFGDDLRVSSGLLTSYSATIPRGRVQFISVQRPWMLRWMGLATIRIETAGGAGAQAGEVGGGALSRSSFVPVLPLARVPEILAELRPGLVWDESAIDWRKTSSRTRNRLLGQAAFWTVAFLVGGLIVNRTWGWIPGLVVALLMTASALKTSRSLRYARTGFGVAFRSGWLNRKSSLTFFDRLQTLRLDQSPFDRRWGMATLSVDTAAAGPANHLIQVPFLDEPFAIEEFRQLQRHAARNRPEWKN